MSDDMGITPQVLLMSNLMAEWLETQQTNSKVLAGISALKARIAELEAALKPFAFAAEYDPDVKISLNDEPLRIFTEDSDLHYETILSTRTAAPLTVGDLRTAYTALNPNKPPMPNGYDTSRTEFSTHSVETEMDEGSEGSSNE